jgi:hypothetical protein
MSELPTIYQLKVVLMGISPMIWRRLLVSGESTITDGFNQEGRDENQGSHPYRIGDGGYR